MLWNSSFLYLQLTIFSLIVIVVKNNNKAETKTANDQLTDIHHKNLYLKQTKPLCDLRSGSRSPKLIWMLDRGCHQAFFSGSNLNTWENTNIMFLYLCLTQLINITPCYASACNQRFTYVWHISSIFKGLQMSGITHQYSKVYRCLE